MKCWVVMEEYAIDDDGDSAVELEAVHLSKEGANANLTPDYAKTGYREGSRRRYAVEMEMLPLCA